VEFKDENGTMRPYPVEYKSGKPKLDESDAAQLCAQALCLEEMTGLSIEEAAIFYGKTRHRLKVVLDDPLRNATAGIIRSVHEMIEKRIVPEAKYMKKCDTCSLVDYCMPGTGTGKIKSYIKGLFTQNEETP